MDTERLKRVLIIKPSSLGDVIHALPVAHALKESIPGVSIDWVVGQGYEEVLSGNPAIGKVITFDRDMLKKGSWPRRLSSFMKELRDERYDLVIDLQGLLRSALMAFVCRSGRRAGFANAREGAPFFYTDKVIVPDPGMHAVDRYLLVLDHIGIEWGGDPEGGFNIDVGDGDDAGAVSLLGEYGLKAGEKFVAFAPSARWDTKRWPARNFVRLANLLLTKDGARCVFAGTAADAGVLAGSEERLLPENPAVFGRTSLKVLAALLKRASLLVTNDSGPMHLAAAVGTPVVAIFGPTDPARTGPYGDKHTVIRAGMECSPCFRRSCDTVKCLTGVTVSQVYETIKGGASWL